MIAQPASRSYTPAGFRIPMRENFHHFLGQFVRNPLDGADPDTKINIEQGVFVPTDPPGVYRIDNMVHYDGVLLSVHFATGSWNTVEGSAVMVAPGIALAAAHVIQHIIEPTPEIMASKPDIFCTGLTSSGPRNWFIRGITKVNCSDLAVLSLDYASPMPPDGRFVQATMTTRLPKIGEQVMIVGFRSSDENLPAEEGIYFPVEDGHIKYGAEVRIGVGEITQYHLDGRGSMPPGPAIEIACSTVGGMSGGPAFDQNGMLVGILSVSPNLADDDGRGPSQVSLLMPALVQTITPSFLPNFYPGPIRLLDLPSDLCGIDGRDAIRSATASELGIIRVEMRDWPEFVRRRAAH
jgi:hypothetical protein